MTSVLSRSTKVTISNRVGEKSMTEKIQVCNKAQGRASSFMLCQYEYMIKRKGSLPLQLCHLLYLLYTIIQILVTEVGLVTRAKCLGPRSIQSQRPKEILIKNRTRRNLISELSEASRTIQLFQGEERKSQKLTLRLGVEPSFLA